MEEMCINFERKNNTTMILPTFELPACTKSLL